MSKQLLHQYVRARAKYIQAKKNVERFRIGEWRWCYWYSQELKWGVQMDKWSNKVVASTNRGQRVLTVGNLKDFANSHTEYTDRFHDKNVF